MERAFFCERGGREWAECSNVHVIQSDIEDVSVAFILHKDGNWQSGFKADALAYGRRNRISEWLEGDMAAAGLAVQPAGRLMVEINDDNRDCSEFPVRWRIFQRDIHSPLHVAVDICCIASPIRMGIHYAWRTAAYDFDMARRVFQQVKKRQEFGIYGKERLLSHMPSIVVAAALEALQASVRAEYGIHGGVLSQMSGVTKLMAYWERPFDLQIVYLKAFIGRDFEQQFPFAEKDCYTRLCRYLDVQPPKSVRRAYTYNPYAILWYLFFRKWGIEDPRYWQPFLRLDNCISGVRLDRFVYDRENKQIVYGDRYNRRRWEKVEWYLRWVLNQLGTKKFCRHLLILSKRPLDSWQYDMIEGLWEYHDRLPVELSAVVLKEGLTECIHDMLSAAINGLQQGKQNEWLHYNKTIQALECQIAGFEFHLVHETAELFRIGVALRNCVATYRERVLAGESIILTMKKAGVYSACLELNREKAVVQVLGKCNARLHGEALQICRYWVQVMGLSVLTDQLDDAGMPDLIGVPVCFLVEADGEDTPMMRYARTVDRENGYFAIALQICQHYGHKIKPPPWMSFASAEDYLGYVWPAGKGLCSAALAGDREAQLAMSVLYRYGVILPVDMERARYWQSLAAGIGREIERNSQAEYLLLGLTRARNRVLSPVPVRPAEVL